ncbi:hypothetical protein [Adhaeribacter soli]|uniref:Uncharacterized protein n=1 Tax=Adhaeribacter soli TaxID=2607655 RepID=A0A5N1J6S2_9BACT|nr:hypothetical protein [Adhaeribacter soli]KAA9340303.1 hypothetical protein F0P94_08120 [Adhaeribacter soli]
MRFPVFLLKKLLFFTLLLAAWPVLGQTLQDQKVLPVSPVVGEVIDLEEKIRYNLFPFADSATFQIGRFLQTPDGIILEIVKRNGKIDYRPYTQSEFELTGQLIEARAKNSTVPPQKTPAPAPAVPVPAQSDTRPAATALSGKVYYVILSNGMKFFGTVAEKRASEYVFNTEYFGTITATFGNIRYMKEVENRLKSGYYWVPNPHDSRLYFGPTGRGIPRGEGYVQTIYGYLNSINYGITDNISIGSTFLLMPFLPLENNIFALTPKISFPTTENTNVAGGVLFVNFLEEQFGLLYSAGTYGNKSDHITAGIGFAFFNGNVSSTPLVMLGGVKRMSNRLAFMSENYILSVPGDRTYGFGLYGLRFIWPRTNLDLGGFYAAYSGNRHDSGQIVSSYFIPIYYSFTFKLGNRKGIGKLE